jgi:hypothetical protein
MRKSGEKKLILYLSIDIFYQFVQILEPGIRIFILKITTHSHHNVIRSKTKCLKENSLYFFVFEKY